MTAQDDMLTAEEVARLRSANPGLGDVTRRSELRSLLLRYGSSMPELRALVAGQPTRAALADAREEANEQRLIATRYPTMATK